MHDDRRTDDAHGPVAARPGPAAGGLQEQAQVRRERLRTLAVRAYDLLDRESDPDFQAVLALAAHVSGAPTAALHLAEPERLRQVAAYGAVPQDSPRGTLLCEDVLAAGEPLHTPDASRDPRWRDNAHVDGRLGSVRLYAGAPLRTPGGHVVGTLCVLDEQPRRLSPAQLDALGLLADQVVALLEARRTSHTLRTALEDLDRIAHLDELTGLPNRSAGLRALQRISASGGWGLLFVDVDDLKTINDTSGHGAGDVALQEVAARLQSALGPHDLLVRWAGDEFVVLLADVHEQDDVQAAADQLRAAVGAPFALDGAPLALSVSLGGQVVPPDSDAELVLRQADLLMYDDKRVRRRGRAPA